MKKSYIRLIIFILINIIVLLLNYLFFKITNKYYLIIYVLILLILFKFLFGFEKDRHRFTKNIIFEIIIYLFCYGILYYLFGIVIGFSETKDYNFFKFILPIIIYNTLKELFRYYIIRKSSESKYLIIISTFLIFLIDLSIPLVTNKLDSINKIYIFFALTFLPLLSENILCTYITYYYGFKPSIIFLLIKKLYVYLIPIVPNPNEYLYSIIEFLIPLILLLIVSKYYKEKKETKNIFFIPTIIITIILVYFISGYFRYYSIAIASDSMEGTFNKGDVVIVDKKYNDLVVGDIIAYKYENHVIVHRINKIIKNKDEIIIYTKGDANNNVDNYKVNKESVIGIVVIIIPFIGYPTVLLNELM